MCSYHRVFLGAALSGLVPKPKCMIYTNLACDSNMMTFPYLKQKNMLPGFFIDVPYDKTEDSVKYVADQLRELKAFLEDVTGKKISEEAVRQAVNNSNQAAAYYHEQLALRKEHDPVTSLTNELYAIFMCHLMAGSQEAVKYTKLLLDSLPDASIVNAVHHLFCHGLIRIFIMCLLKSVCHKVTGTDMNLVTVIENILYRFLQKWHHMHPENPEGKRACGADKCGWRNPFYTLGMQRYDRSFQSDQRIA